MKSLVLELQQLSYDTDISISELLRKAYVVAKKLRVNQFEEWLDAELNGYKGQSNTIPEYRQISGEVKAWNPYHGWVPVIIHDPAIAEALTKNKVCQPITEIEALLKETEGTMFMKYPAEVERKLAKAAKFSTTYEMHISSIQLKGIIEYVRNIVLQWVLQLEDDGIVGEDLSFSDQERKLAQQKGYNVYNFYGDISNSQLYQGTINSVQTTNNLDRDDQLERISDLIIGNISKTRLSKESVDAILAELGAIKSEVKSLKPKHPLVKQGLDTIKNILEGAAGDLVASGILYEISKII
jgi:hypothetical protein